MVKLYKTQIMFSEAYKYVRQTTNNWYITDAQPWNTLIPASLLLNAQEQIADPVDMQNTTGWFPY